MEREVVEAMHKDLDKILEALGAKYNFKITKSNITYSEAGFSVSLSAAEINNDGSVKINPEKNYKMRAALALYLDSIPEKVQGIVFKHEGIEYIIVDWNNRARSYPFIYQNKSGQQYKAGAAFIAARIRESMAKSSIARIA